jgi:splicing factor 3A subunit 1
LCSIHFLIFSIVCREAEEAIAAGKDPATLIAQKAAAKVEQPAAAVAAPQPVPIAPPKSVVASNVKAAIINPIAKLAKDIPDKLPYQFDFIVNHPTGVTELDIDIIKLTAQYTAVNGRDFLANIAQREQRNPQFDFLKPTHMLFSYFTSLVDSYAKIVHPTPELQQRIISRTDPNKVYEYAVHRWGWTKAEKERKFREENEANQERLAFQQIDWSDFSIVEVIDFPEDELFEIPGLTNLALGNQQQVNQQSIPSATSSLSQIPPPPPPPPSFKGVSGGAAAKAPPAPPAPPKAVPMAEEEDDDDDEIKVVSNYQQRLGQTASTQPLMMIDPVSGKPIPLNQLEEHMRIQLLDPKWKEEQKRFQEKQKETGYAEGASIAGNLKLFARKRGDIFGQSTSGPESAAMIAQLEEQERKKNEEQSKVQWDGFFATMGTTQKLKELETSSDGQPPPPQMMMSSIGPSAMVPPPPMPMMMSSAGGSAMPGMPGFYPPPPPPPSGGGGGMMMMGGMPMPGGGMMGMPPPPPPAFGGYSVAPPPLPTGSGFMPVPPPGMPPAPVNSDESKAKKPRLESTCKKPPLLLLISPQFSSSLSSINSRRRIRCYVFRSLYGRNIRSE